MPDTLMFPPAAVASEADDHALAAALMREVAASRHPRVILDQPLPIAASPVVETLADCLNELDRDLARLRRRRSAPPSIGGRIRQAVAESLGALCGAGAGIVTGRIGERSQPPGADDGRVNLRLVW